MSENSGKCYHFHTYDFMNDATFLKGWDKIKLLAEGDPVDQQRKLLQAKAFYYSQTFEPITTEEYKEWMEKTCSDIAKGDYGCKAAAGQVSDAEKSFQGLNIDKDKSKKCPSSSGKIVNKDASETFPDQKAKSEDSNKAQSASNKESPHPTSFTDIVKLIEQGEAIPGVEQLNVKPTNTEPTQSAHDRVSKPWEKS